MTTSIRILTGVGLLLLVTDFTEEQQARAQHWTGILDSSRATDWSRVASLGNIPKRDATCAAIAPYGAPGFPASPAAINTSLASCPAGQVVRLEAGHFYLSSGIVFSNKSQVTLRGAGPEKTFVHFYAPDSCGGLQANICVRNAVPYYRYSPQVQVGGTQAAAWTGGFMRDATEVALTNVVGLAVGDTLILDEVNDNGISVPIAEGGASQSGGLTTFRTLGQHVFSPGQIVDIGGVSVDGYKGIFTIATAPDKTSFQVVGLQAGLGVGGGGIAKLDTGTFRNCDLPGICRPTGATGGQARCSVTAISDSDCDSRQGAMRNHMQLVRVTGVKDKLVGISPPLCSDFDPASGPGAWWTGRPVSGVGIESMSLFHSASTGAQSGVAFFDANESWIRNVKSVMANRNHVWVFQSSRVAVVDNYFLGNQGSGAKSYGVELNITSDDLVENNIFQACVSSVIMDGGATGVVTAYNYFFDGASTSPETMTNSVAPGHTPGTMLNLFEGNIGTQFWQDYAHGSNGLTTSFRDYWSGFQASPTKYATIPIDLYAGSRGNNIVGSVLGMVGYHTHYESSADVREFDPDHCIYVLGYGFRSDRTLLPFDPYVQKSLMRWGNFDAATGVVRFESSEVPSSQGKYRNGVPATKQIPPSFYLSSKPVWWGLSRWPAIGPDVLGGSGPGGHVFDTPARSCAGKSVKNADGTLRFDADACYESRSPRVLPPTNLVVQPR
jgi:hypothetical protein